MVDFGISNDRLGIVAVRDPLHVFEKPLSQHENAAVAGCEMLFGPVGDGPLSDPRDEILIHDVTGNPAARVGILHGSAPGRNALLLVWLAFFRDAAEAPRDAQ